MLTSLGVVMIDSHFVYTSGLHGRVYVNKDALFPHTTLTETLCSYIAVEFYDDCIDVVVAPAVGGIPLSLFTAYHLTLIANRGEVLSTYAERDEISLLIL